MITDQRLAQIALEEGLSTVSFETCGKLLAVMRRVRDETVDDCTAERTTPRTEPSRTDLPDPQPLWRSIDITAGMIWDAIHRSDTLEDFAHHISEAAKAVAKEGLK